MRAMDTMAEDCAETKVSTAELLVKVACTVAVALVNGDAVVCASVDQTLEPITTTKASIHAEAIGNLQEKSTAYE